METLPNQKRFHVLGRYRFKLREDFGNMHGGLELKGTSSVMIDPDLMQNTWTPASTIPNPICHHIPVGAGNAYPPPWLRVDLPGSAGN